MDTPPPPPYHRRMAFIHDMKNRPSVFRQPCWRDKQLNCQDMCFEPIVYFDWGTGTLEGVPCWMCEPCMSDIFDMMYDGSHYCCHVVCPVCRAVHHHLDSYKPTIWEDHRNICESMVFGRRVFLRPCSEWIMEIGSSIQSIMIVYTHAGPPNRPLPTPAVTFMVDSSRQDGFVPIYTPITILVDACQKYQSSSFSVCAAAMMLWQQKAQCGMEMLSHASLCEYTADWIRVTDRDTRQLDQSVAELCGCIHAVHIMLEHHTDDDAWIYTDRSAWFTTVFSMHQGVFPMLANADGNYTAIFLLLLLITESLYFPGCKPHRTITFRAVGSNTLGVYTSKVSRKNNMWYPINIDQWTHLMQHSDEFWEPKSYAQRPDLSQCTIKSATDCMQLLQSLSVERIVDSRYDVCNNVISITFSRNTLV